MERAPQAIARLPSQIEGDSFLKRRFEGMSKRVYEMKNTETAHRYCCIGEYLPIRKVHER